MGEDDLLISPVEEMMVTPPPAADRAVTSQGAERRSAAAKPMVARVPFLSINFILLRDVFWDKYCQGQEFCTTISRDPPNSNNIRTERKGRQSMRQPQQRINTHAPPAVRQRKDEKMVVALKKQQLQRQQIATAAATTTTTTSKFRKSQIR